MAIRAGRLRHRIEVQTLTASQDTYGAIVNAWATTATVWGSIEPLTGRERLASDVVQADMSHRCIMRHRALTVKDRLKFGARIFNIVSIADQDERATRIEIMAKEEV